MEFKRLYENSKDLYIFEEINREAIPLNERTSLASLFKTAGDKGLDITGIYVSGKPAGFYAVRIYKNVAYLAYIAIKNSLRSKGFGSRAVEDLKEKYKNMQIVVEYDAPDDNSEDGELRKRRKKFYLKNGFCETGYYNCYDGAEFEIACACRDFDIGAFTEFTNHLSALIDHRIPEPYKKER